MPYKIYKKLTEGIQLPNIEEINLSKVPSESKPKMFDYYYEYKNLFIYFLYIGFNEEQQKHVFEIACYKKKKTHVIGWEKVDNLINIEQYFKERLMDHYIYKAYGVT